MLPKQRESRSGVDQRRKQKEAIKNKNKEGSRKSTCELMKPREREKEKEALEE